MIVAIAPDPDVTAEVLSYAKIDRTIKAISDGLEDLLTRIYVEELNIEIPVLTVVCTRLATYYPEGVTINTNLGPVRVEFLKKEGLVY